jgi:primosomal protein N' (replication factor Y)
MPFPAACPTCHKDAPFAACGPGIERIAEEVARSLPNARYAIMASDTLQGPEAAQALIKQMENKEIDVLIGTQIMAKGYHFPRLTLVGVIDADLGLGGGDPRASERTFQLLQQVSGRSGRADQKGVVYLQTTAPDHPVMKALLKGERDAFMKAELNERQAYHLPPFTRLACLTLSGKDRQEVIGMTQKIASLIPPDKSIRVLGPAPAAFSMLRGRYRHRILIQAPRKMALSAFLRDWLSKISLPRTLSLQIDVDPYNFL